MRAFTQLLLALAIVMALAIALIVLLFFWRLGDVCEKGRAALWLRRLVCGHYPRAKLLQEGFNLLFVTSIPQSASPRRGVCSGHYGSVLICV